MLFHSESITRLNQLPNRLRVAVHQILRPAGEVADGRAMQIDAKGVIERGEDFLEGDGAVFGVFGVASGGADSLAGAQAAAGEQGAGDGGPVVATGVGVDARGAAELAPDDDR